MNQRIYPLPPSLINQMAAGEVIERPASVVKELLENALDAHAKNIHINIEAAGIKLIEISDDGIGIHPEDLPLTIMNHATSKIRTLDDLFSIQSLGFRGEALSSIAGVSRFSLLSRQENVSEGYLLSFDELKQEVKISPQARKPGTTVTVSDLFFNTPVRRQFLASEKTEWLQIEQMVKRIALSQFDVGFQLTHKNTIWHLPRITLENDLSLKQSRIKKIFGTPFINQSTFLDTHRDNMRLWGWVGSPSLMRSQNDQQYFYLNGRMIRDKLINHAIRSAYENHLYPGRQPVFILYLEISPETVDVNVHPTKHEVRFREQRQVHDFVYHQISQILNKPTVSFENKIQEENGCYLTNLKPDPQKSPHKNLSHTEMTLQWLEFPYCLLKSDAAFFLCHYTQLYQSLCRERFIAEIDTQTVTTRPFLVPVRIKPIFQISKIILDNQATLSTLGLTIDPLDQDTHIIRTFPGTLPYFNVQTWLKILEKLDKKASPDFIETLVEANTPPLSTSTLHEHHALLSEFQEYLAKSDIPPAIKNSYKIMTLTDWEKILKNAKN